MAKGKSAVALFEVISKDKRFGRRNSDSPPLKSAVFTEEPQHDAQKSPVEDTANFAARAVDLWRKRNSDPETWTFSPMKIRKSLGARISAVSAACKSILAKAAKIAGVVPIVRAWIVRQNSIACGVAAAAIVIGALLGLRHWYRPAPQAQPIEEVLRNGPAHPAVLAIAPEAPSSPAPQTLSPEMQADVQQASDKIAAPIAPVSALAQPGARIINMHYVLMQSYFEEKTAIEARDFLINHGIPCTIERGVKGWRPDFYQVIGLQGFARPSGAEYQDYIRQIEKLGMEFAPKSRYKRFVPLALKW
jgi:hypothetical protein